MKKLKVFTAILLALCLTGAAVLAEEDDYSGIMGTWYTEEIMMTITEEGRFTVEWFDGDWTGLLEGDLRTNENGDEYTVYRMILDNPEDSMWEELELVPDIYHPGKMSFYFDGNPREVFYNVPVYAMDMEGEDLSYYEPYFFIDEAGGEEPAVPVMFTLLRPATDIAVMKMFNQRIDEEGNLLYNADALEWWAELDSQEHIVVTHVFEGDMPDLGIGFIAEDGTSMNFAVEISGEDGELILIPLLPSNG